MGRSPGQARAGAPVFIAQGTADTTVEPAITKRFAEALCAQGTPVTFVSLPGVTHTFVARDSANAALRWMTDRFEERRRTQTACGSGSSKRPSRRGDRQDQDHQEQNDEHEEQDLGDLRRAPRDAGIAERAGDQRDQQADQGPFQKAHQCLRRRPARPRGRPLPPNCAGHPARRRGCYRIRRLRRSANSACLRSASGVMCAANT